MTTTIKKLTRERVTPNVDLVRKITPAQARKFFGDRMYGPEQVQRFAKSNPVEFNRVIQKTSLFMALAASPDEPLGNFIRDGNLDISIELDEQEQRRLIIPADKLKKAGRDMNRPDILNIPSPLLLITGGYTIDQSGSTYTVVFDRESLDNLAQSLKLYDKPRFDCWHSEIGGMPVGEASTRNNPDSLNYQYLYGAFGSVRRGHRYYGDLAMAGGGRFVYFCGMLGDLSAVLVPAADLKGLAEAAETELGDKLAGFPATRQFIEAGKRQDLSPVMKYGGDT